jgi:aspartyl/glutamyl-tRNA(Asn/Gln) amidotransferase C subunit
MKVTRSQVQRIAELAELHVDDAAAAQLEEQITRILDYVERIGELPHEDTVGDPRAVRLRPDVPAPDPLVRPPVEWAAAMRDGLFIVPRLGDLDRGEDAP